MAATASGAEGERAGCLGHLALAEACAWRHWSTWPVALATVITTATAMPTFVRRGGSSGRYVNGPWNSFEHCPFTADHDRAVRELLRADCTCAPGQIQPLQMVASTAGSHRPHRRCRQHLHTRSHPLQVRTGQRSRPLQLPAHLRIPPASMSPADCRNAVDKYCTLRLGRCHQSKEQGVPSPAGLQRRRDAPWCASWRSCRRPQEGCGVSWCPVPVLGALVKAVAQGTEGITGWCGKAHDR